MKYIAALCIGVIFVVLLICGCSEELKYTPRPATFTSFYPDNGIAGIEPVISIYWTCEHSQYYDLYLGTDPENLSLIAENILHSDELGGAEYTISTLHLETTYYWQVVGYNGDEEPTYDDIHSFSTRSGNWQSVSPADNAFDQELDISLSWQLREELREPTPMSYDIYFGTDPDNLILLSENLAETTFPLNDLLWETNYFWQILSRNDLKELAPSPVFEFHTKNPDWLITSPPDSSYNQSTDIVLQWNITNAFSEQDTLDSDQFIYDIYLGSQESNLVKIADNLSDTLLAVNNLNYRQNYFWQIKAMFNTSQELTSPIFNFMTLDRFTFMSPADQQDQIDKDIDLTWICLDGVSYDIYFGDDLNGLQLISQNYSDTLYSLYNLDYETNYLWQIEAILSDGSTWQSNIQSFTTTIDPILPGYNLHKHLVRAQIPCNIDVVFSVTDRGDKPTDILNQSDFLFLEDSLEIDPVESYLQIYDGEQINSSLKTILMIDNSVSMDNLLEDIKLAAIHFVENMQPNQQTCLYCFSEYTQLLQDFTSSQADLISAINSISTGFASTDLYGSVIEGVNRWDDVYSPENLHKGFLIMITDGSDTQSSSSLAQALQARGDKQIYSIGIGNNVDNSALSALGNADFIHLYTVDQAYNTFDLVQNEIIDYLNGIYWLHYITPKRGDVDHSITISIPSNPNTDSSAIIEGSFNSNGFFGTLPGVYINVDPDNDLPYGIDEYSITDSTDNTFTAFTYLPDNDPLYQWSIADSSSAFISWISPATDQIIISPLSSNSTTQLTVHDTINDHYKSITLIINR